MPSLTLNVERSVKHEYDVLEEWWLFSLYPLSLKQHATKPASSTRQYFNASVPTKQLLLPLPESQYTNGANHAFACRVQRTLHILKIRYRSGYTNIAIALLLRMRSSCLTEVVVGALDAFSLPTFSRTKFRWIACAQ